MKEDLKNKIDHLVQNISRLGTEEGREESDRLMKEAMALAVTPEEKKEAGAYLRQELIMRRKRPDVDVSSILGDTRDILSLLPKIFRQRPFMVFPKAERFDGEREKSLFHPKGTDGSDPIPTGFEPGTIGSFNKNPSKPLRFGSPHVLGAFSCTKKLPDESGSPLPAQGD